MLEFELLLVGIVAFVFAGFFNFMFVVLCWELFGCFGGSMG